MSDTPNPAEDARELEELFKQHPSLRVLHARQQSNPAEEGLRRVALARTFTRDLYEKVLCADLGLKFDELISRPEVEPVPQKAGYYWLRESAQRAAAESWAQNPQKRTYWAERIYQHAKSSDSEPLELAIQQLRFDPESARVEIRKLYDSADDANDLPLCRLIVETLGSLKAEIAGMPMDDDRREYSSRYSARAMFLVEHHRSAAYFPRSEPAEAFDKVLAEAEGRWILHLFAAGGMGKTMFLQWTISRSLVTSPERALVARLDMDFLSVNALTRCPWLMAIEIGRQIDQQLAAPAFDKFLASLTSFGGLLYSPLSERYQALSSKDAQDLIQRARNLSTHWSRFASIMASLPRDRKIVILVDTIEEASLYYPEELRTIIRQFEELKETRTVPQLRLVLSGRYQLGREHLADLWDETIAAATRPCELQPFSDEVAARFVRARLPGKPDDLVQAIVRSAGGFPFKLAMFVELVLDDANIKALQIEKYRDADVAYVIERVIKRIGLNDARRGEEAGGTANEHQSLRWVVRYGAIPRKLTLSFLKNVMKPHLDRALTGEAKQSGDDDPELDVWWPDPDANRDPDALWKELTNYSSERGWVTVDPHDQELASFHPDIVNPLRRLLRKQRVFIPLHRDAAKHFRARAEREPDRWAEWKAAELYHWSESSETSRARDALLEARQHEPSVRLSLYNDVLRHRDFEGLPSEVRAEAHLAMADAIVADGEYDYALTGTAREQVKTNVLAARTLQKDEITPFWDLWLSVDTETPADLVRKIQATLLASYLTDSDRQRLCLLFASLHPETSIRLEVLETGLSIAERTRSSSPLVPAWIFRRRLSQEHERAGNLLAARETAAASVKELEGAQNPVRLSLAARMMTIDLSMLRLERADDLALKFRTESAELARLSARMHLLIGNPWWVKSILRGKEQEPEDLLLHAEAAAQQLSITESLAMFDRAEQAFERIGSVSGMNRVRISRLRFLTLEAGIEPRTALVDCPPSDQPAESEILRAYGNMERPSYAANILHSLEKDESPGVRARGLIAGLTWGVTPQRAAQEAGRQLVETLEKIQPASARLALLDPPLLEGSFPLLDGDLVTKLEDLFSAKPEGSAEAWIYCLRYADLLRALGKYTAALDLLPQIRPIPNLNRSNLWPLMALRRRRLIEDRIRAVRPETPIELDPIAVWEPFQADPFLYAAVLVETAERALGAGDVATVRECLQGAKPVLETHTRFAQQYRRVEEALTTSGTSKPEVRGARLDHPIVVITRQSRRLAVWNSNLARRELISAVEDPALDVVAAVRGWTSASRVARPLTDLIVEDWRVVASQFDKVVSSPWIVVPDPQLAGVPWELCAQQVVRLVIEDHDFRVKLDQLQFEPAQLTEILSRQWQDARREAGTPGEVVWLALPEGGDAIQRSAGAYADLPRRFQAAGMTPALLPEASSEKRMPSLVYLGCGIEQVQEIPRLTSGFLTAVTLGSMLAAARTSARPIVILDPPRPYSLSEAVECLYWRNLFAHELMNTGTVAAVLALGLAPYEEQSQNIERLLKAIHERASLTRLLEDIRASASDDDPIDRIVAFRAAALFTLDPNQRFDSGPGARQ